MKTPTPPATTTDAPKAPARATKLKPTGSSGEPGAKRSIFDDAYGPVGAETRKPWSRHTGKDKAGKDKAGKDKAGKDKD